MPAAADKKRKKNAAAAASPAKKRKVDSSPKKKTKQDDKKKTPKKTVKAAPPKKASSGSKVQKSSVKGNKPKQTDSKAKVTTAKNKDTNKKKSDQGKKNVKAQPASKKTAAKPVKKEVKKAPAAKAKPQAPKKNQKAAAAKPKPAAAKALTRAKLNTKAKTAQTTVAKAKLKAVKSLTKPKQQSSKKEPAKPKATNKPEVKKTAAKTPVKEKAENKPKTVVKKDEEKRAKAAEKPKGAEKKPSTPKKEPPNDKASAGSKRKGASDPEPVDTPRKKRVITPNKRYADFETDTSPKRISELRAYVQDKKKPATIKPEIPAKSSKQEASASKVDTTPIKKSTSKDEDERSPVRKPMEIKVIKASEMKPAEKLLRKLQKKLEREAKAAFVKPKKTPNKDTAKTKITKVVTYNKPAFSKTETKQTTPKEKSKPAKPTKPAVIVKKKPAPAAEKEVKVITKAAPSPKKIREQKKDERKIQSKFLFQKDVRQPDDANTNCWITGIDIFKSGEVVLVDMSNKKIKLFNSNFEYMSQAKLDTTPQDISISPLDAGMAYFTKPFSKEGIQKVCLSDGNLTLKDSFLTNGTNRGVKCIKSGILTSVQNGRYHDLDINLFKIDLLDYKGNVLKSVSVDQNGMRLFKLPLYFTVSNNEKQIIVSDCIRNNSYIVSLDMSGKIRFKFTGFRDNPITPRGLTIDDEDNIYVTEWERHNVYVLTPSGKRLQLLLDHVEQLKAGQDGLNKPYQLCYYKHENQGRLIVSKESCNTIKVFHISQKQNEQNGNTAAAVATASPVKQPVTEPAKPLATPAETVAKPATAATSDTAKVAVVKPVSKAPAPAPEEKPVSPEKPVEQAIESPAKDVVKVVDATSVKVVDATTILSQEHAYTTLALPDEKKSEPIQQIPVSTEELPSDPIEEEGPQELSSIVDSIISDLNSREPQSLQATTGAVVQEQSF